MCVCAPSRGLSKVPLTPLGRSLAAERGYPPRMSDDDDDDVARVATTATITTGERISLRTHDAIAHTNMIMMKI